LIILIDSSGEPKITLDADAFLRMVLLEDVNVSPLRFCHYLIIINDPATKMGDAIVNLKVYPERKGDDVIDHDIILYWGKEQKKVITGSDVLGRLLRGLLNKRKRCTRI